MKRTERNSEVAAFGRFAHGAWLMVALALWPAACDRAPKENLLERAETFCLEGRWDESIPLLKEYLLEHPNDPGAHFYLGRCYFNRTPPYLFASAGEYDTALTQFVKNGRKSTIQRYGDSFFEFMCIIDAAKIPLRITEVLVESGAAPSEIEPYVRACEAKLEAARAIDPNHQDVKDFERLLEDLRKIIGLGAQGPSPAPQDI